MNVTHVYVVSIAPVGPGNISVGYFRITGNAPGLGGPPSELFAESVVLPLHLLITDPANRTLFNADIVTPDFFAVDFNTRGDYLVYLTNNGNKSESIPIGVQFGEGNLQNREFDKYMLSVTLTLIGVILIVVGVVKKLVAKPVLSC
ncbi:MAG: hypothetical protein LBQ98_06315 [Nitrososphaerota archaeon]|nr:hypothetical protein [Nitrososphaerota archaeon]